MLLRSGDGWGVLIDVIEEQDGILRYPNFVELINNGNGA